MKTFILAFLSLCLGFMLYAQQPPSVLKTGFDLKRLQPVKYDAKSLHAFTGNETVHSAVKNAPFTFPTSGQTPGSIVIGTTLYDLQTNDAIARRLLRRSDGTITAVWTMSQETSFTDRGTGYAYFNGTSWTCTDPTTRLEPLRTGWPTIGMLKGSEFIISHNGAGTCNLEQSSTSGVGKCSPTDWNFVVSGAAAPIPPHDTESIWPRMAIQGNTIHVISNAANATGESLAGVSDPFVYARSADGGQTWTPNITLPLNTSARRLSGSADEYDIDYNAGTASIVQGGLGYDVALWESTNSGASWHHIYVDSFPYAPDYTKFAPDSLVVPTNDGAVSVVVDNASKTHVAYSLGQVLQIDGSGYYVPFTIGLKYWEDGMKQPVWVVNPDSLPTAFDANGDGIYTVGSTTMNSGLAGSADQYVNQSWLSQPSISYDSCGDVFITFILPHDADTTFDGQTYRHIYMASHKEGDPWSMAYWKIQDVNQNIIFVENAFATTARFVDDSIRIMYMEDLEPGTALSDGDPVGTNNINYIAVANPYCGCPALSVSFGSMQYGALTYQFRTTDKNVTRFIWDFGDGTTSNAKNPIHTYAKSGNYKVCLKEIAGCSRGASCKRLSVVKAKLDDQNAIAFGISVYPNPFSSETQIQFSLDQKTNAQLDLYDVQGRLLRTIASGNFDAGEHAFQLNKDELTEGIYFLRLKTSEGITDKKIIIQ